MLHTSTGSRNCDSEGGALSSVQQAWSPAASMPDIGVMREPRWYAIYTRSRCEKRAAQQLQERGVTTFLPLVSERHRWSDRYRAIECALFPSYAFVRIVSGPEARLTVVSTPGVLGLVGIGGAALSIPDKEIEDIQTLIVHRALCEPYPFLRIGQRVRIRGGCFEGVEGILLSKNSVRSLVVSVELIQRSVAVRIDGYDVEPV